MMSSTRAAELTLAVQETLIDGNVDILGGFRRRHNVTPNELTDIEGLLAAGAWVVRGRLAGRPLADMEPGLDQQLRDIVERP